MTSEVDRFHQLYRHFDKVGNLLYVGISYSAVSRASQHKQGSEWYKHSCKMTIENFSNRNELITAERQAIESESPLYNKMLNSSKPDKTNPCNWDDRLRTDNLMQGISDLILHNGFEKGMFAYYDVFSDATNEHDDLIEGIKAYDNLYSEILDAANNVDVYVDEEDFIWNQISGYTISENKEVNVFYELSHEMADMYGISFFENINIEALFKLMTEIEDEGFGFLWMWIITDERIYKIDPDRLIFAYAHQTMLDFLQSNADINEPYEAWKDVFGLMGNELILPKGSIRYKPMENDYGFLI